MKFRTPAQELLNTTAWQPQKWIGLNTGKPMAMAMAEDYPALREIAQRTTSAILRIMYHVKT